MDAGPSFRSRLLGLLRHFCLIGLACLGGVLLWAGAMWLVFTLFFPTPVPADR